MESFHFSDMAYSYEGRRADSVLLNGEWIFSIGEGDEKAETLAGQKKLDWRPVNLPGHFMEWNQDAAKNIKFVWAKRTFSVSEGQSERLAVLRWNRIAFGAVAFINGHRVGENEPTGPYQVLLPRNSLNPGNNEIVFKISGAAGVRKAKSGYFLIPAGFATLFREGMPAVTDDIWIDFSEKAYMKWVLAMPDLNNSLVKLRVTPISKEKIENLMLTAEVRPWPAGEILGTGEASAGIVPTSGLIDHTHFFIDIPMPGFKPWTPEMPNLYTADVKLIADGRVLDTLNTRFGMREIDVAEGNYKLNSKNLWLRGSSLVFEWDWGDVITGKEIDYLVTEAREMNMNSFRTHTRPPPKLWADIGDEYGTMILAEFPCLYNDRNFNFTPEEYDIWHKNVLTDAEGWMARLWNHPSVIMWVLSNESRYDSEWEKIIYRNFVLDLDPTRPTMRAGGRTGNTYTGTKENLDVHTCHNLTKSVEGYFQVQISDWFTQANGRTVTNTEYMNVFKRPIEQWTGTNDQDADRIAYVQLGMEFTEAMRRARLDGIWPYMYAGWTKSHRKPDKNHRDEEVEWKAGFAHPASACWHSALSPVLVSLDLFNPSYITGQVVETDLYLINDSWHDSQLHVDLLLTKENPEFIPEAECLDRPLAKWSFDFEIRADHLIKVPVKWRLPEKEGNYWLTARTTGVPGRPVLSQRFVRAVNPPKIPPSVRKRTYIILGGDSSAKRYFHLNGIQTSNRIDRLDPCKPVVLIWDVTMLTIEEKQKIQALHDFAVAGGNLIVLSAKSWDWPALCDLKVNAEKGPFSRVFINTGTLHPMLSGIDPEWLKRWNGLPGTVAIAEIQGSALKNADKILWARQPGTILAAEVSTPDAKGKILFSQLDIRGHLDHESPNYDPVAERIFLNLLGL